MAELARFGVSMSSQLLEKFDELIEKKGYTNRSEAIRDMIRDYLVEKEWQQEDGEVAGTITIVYDHHGGGLANLLTELQHQYNQLIISTMHVHLDAHNCLEVLVVKGKPADARAVAERLISVKGVKHGKLTITSTGKELV